MRPAETGRRSLIPRRRPGWVSNSPSNHPPGWRSDRSVPSLPAWAELGSRPGRSPSAGTARRPRAPSPSRPTRGGRCGAADVPTGVGPGPRAGRRIRGLRGRPWASVGELRSSGPRRPAWPGSLRHPARASPPHRPRPRARTGCGRWRTTPADSTTTRSERKLGASSRRGPTAANG